MKVKELPRWEDYPPKLKNDIKTTLINKAGGTFLWASLVLNDISKTKMTSKIREKLEGLPANLGEVYEKNSSWHRR